MTAMPAISLRLKKHPLVLLVLLSGVISWASGCVGITQSSGGNPTPPAALSISAVASSTIASDTVTITWTTNLASNSQVDYGATANYGQSSTLNSSMVTSHTVALSGLSASTTYHYRAKSVDASNHQVASADFTFTTTAAAMPPSISALAANGITSSAAIIVWTTNVAANSQVEYGTTASYGQSRPSNASMVTSHSVALSGLAASTLYHYRVKSADASNNLAISGDFTFTTAAAAAPPVISAVAASGITSSGATISWTTNVAASSQADYGTTTNYGQSTLLNSSVVTGHSVAVSGLAASTLYHYRVKSADASNNQATSGDFTFTTAAGSTSGSLTVSITAPAQGTTVGGTVAVTASASDNVTIIGVQYQLDGANLGPLFREVPYTLFWDTSLAGNGSHVLTAVAKDVSAASATSNPVSVTILNNSSTVVNLTPANWCNTINGAAPGTTFVLAPGSYTDSCHITASGTAAAPITIRSQGSATASRANLVYNGTNSNLVDLGGSYIAMRWLTLGPSQSGVDGIRIRGTHDDVIEENLFQSVGGVGVPNNDGGSTPRITIRNNVFNNGQSTVIYLGCHDGAVCHSPDALVEGNLINGAQPGDGVGSGVQIKLNSYATVRDNTIYNTTGAGIIIYGSSEGDPASVVEGNYVEGAQQDAGINTSGGPAIVRNNIVVGNGNFGIWAQDYNGRNLQTNVWLVENTVLNNQGGGISVQNWQSGRGDILAYNAITPLSGTSAFSGGSGMVTGNITCSPAMVCFDQPSTEPFDLWPLSGGPLIGAAAGATAPLRPFDDFMGVLRPAAADAGAFQRTGSASGPAVGNGKPRPPRQ
jgi:Bacterial Ig domain/Right handed beta helix region/Purple acid Phosphatase, N-terminal domain